MPAWLVRVGGIMQKTVAATAVAGPRTLNSGSTVCNVAPMMVCGDSGCARHVGLHAQRAGRAEEVHARRSVTASGPAIFS